MNPKTSKRRTKDTFRTFYTYIEEIGLVFEMREICLAHRVTLSDIYLDIPGPSIHAARLEVWWWLWQVIGKSAGEIARMFDRDSNSIAFGMKRLMQEVVDRKANGEVPSFALTKENVRSTAIGVASKTSDARARSANRMAATRRGTDSSRQGALGTRLDPDSTPDILRDPKRS